VVKFFVLFLLDESFLHQDELKLTLMRLYGGFANCEDIFRWSMREFIGAFFAFIEVQTAMIVEFYGVIHAMEEAQKMGFTNV